MNSPPTLRRTPLHALHLEHGAKLTPFAGYEMPLQYAGIIAEHRQVRAAAGLFDVSHMGVISVRGDAREIESLMPADIVNLRPGRQRYSLLTNARGGILDDLMVQNLDGEFLLVVNAARKQHDFAHIRGALSACEVTLRDDALLALQGPAAAAALAELDGGEHISTLQFMHARALRIGGVDCIAARSGYTGEDGFEIAMPPAHAESFARALLAHPAVEFAGLGARDTLRMEAGLCLYGADIDETTTPVEANLTWAIAKARRENGARAGGFPGAEIILQQLRDGVARRRVGLLPAARAPVRAGAELFDSAGARIGQVTSGGFGASMKRAISIGYAQSAHAKPGAQLHARVRGAMHALQVTPLPFVAHNFFRG